MLDLALLLQQRGTPAKPDRQRSGNAAHELADRHRPTPSTIRERHELNNRPTTITQARLPPLLLSVLAASASVVGGGYVRILRNRSRMIVPQSVKKLSG
jgi:hypothetical protein